MCRMPKITCVACLAVLLVTAVTAQTTGSYEKVHSSLMAQAEANAHGYGQVGFSPEILAIPQKPFTATRTYSYQRTENGKNVGERVTAECTIARDDKGRIHYEMACEACERKEKIGGCAVHIYDPVAHTLTRYFARADHSLPSEPKANVRKLALMRELIGKSMSAATPKDEGEENIDAPPATEEPKPTNQPPQSAVAIVPTKDDLPVQWVDGMPAVIHRTVEKTGDKQQFVLIQDNWFSPDFAMDIRMIVLRETGKQTFGTKDIVSGEPDPALFEIPPGYAIQLDR